MILNHVKSWRQLLSLILEIVFLVFVVSFFLKLGSDTLEQPALQISYLVFLILGLLVLVNSRTLGDCFKSPTVISFFLFFGFQLARLGWATWQMGVRGLEDSVMLPLHRYLASPVTWFVSIGFFLMGVLLFRERRSTQRLLWTLAWSGFLLAVVAIPPLLIKGDPSYSWPSGRHSYFPPVFYFHQGIGKYLLASYTNPNYIGDVVSLGFFAALGIFFYRLQQKSPLVSLILPGLLVATQALAVILFFSRATIICFTAAFFLFLILTLIKFPSRTQLIFAGIATALVVGFLLWAGNVNETWKEVQTVSGELDENKETSFSATREGAQRALAIFETFPLWGVGTRGYGSVSEYYATPGVNIPLTDFKVLCHYLQTLAEEGTGTFIYFLFLLSFLIESGIRLFKTQSRFQFMSALAFYASVALVLAHAAVKPVMDYFAIACPVYILMGSTLAVLRDDFEHA